MFAKHLLQKATHHFQHKSSVESADIDFRIITHYGIPATASILAFDSIQRLLAIATLDGRIKVIGGDNIEALLIAPKKLPYKYLEFLENQGYLVSISNDNEIQVWDLESRCITCCLQWESNISAFSVIKRSHFMYVGDEYGLTSVLKYEAESKKLLQLPYNISAKSLYEAAGLVFDNHQPIVGVLPQPLSSGNRILIAYQNGLIILWDVLKALIISVRGDKDLRLKSDEVDSHDEEDEDVSYLEEKEISALCWASSDGSILAVGYIDGDILFWNTSTASVRGQEAGLSRNLVVKLQISAAERRLPVIVLNWSLDNRSSNNVNGQLFIYGGDEIGAEEFLTVLSLEWSSKMDSVKCHNRMNVSLNGSFADMILLPSLGVTETNKNSDLFVLTSPGQLHIYDDASLSVIISDQEKKAAISSIEYPAVIPTADPNMRASKLVLLDEKSSKSLSEMTLAMKDGSKLVQIGNENWPLTGGVPSQMSFTKNKRIERIYVVGYQDGSIRIWNATDPVFSTICVLEGEVQGIEVAGFTSTVTKLDFCYVTLKLAVGTECGLVRVYDLNGSSRDTNFHFVTESKREAHILPQGRGPQCRAVFSLLSSPVWTLNFSSNGIKLAVGFGCGRVAVLDMNLLSVRFITDHVSTPHFPVVSLIFTTHVNNLSLLESEMPSASKHADNPSEELIFILTKDAKVNIIDGDTGKMRSSQPLHLRKESVAFSMYVIESSLPVSEISTEQESQQSSKDINPNNEPLDSSRTTTHLLNKKPQHSSSEMDSGERSLDSLLLLCCEDSLHVYSTRSIVQGNKKALHKFKLEKPCCWATIFRRDEKVYGLVLLYQSGILEIRSFPDLTVVSESSLMSILRWNFKTNMDKTLSSYSGHIALVNGCEMAFISFLAGENDLRSLESLPCLHDKVLAAAADVAINHSANQKKIQKNTPGILGGIGKGFKGGKGAHSVDPHASPFYDYTHLEHVFSKSPILDPSPALENENILELNIDDIEIDEPVTTESSSSHKVKYGKTGKGSDREKLFEGAHSDTEPRVRTKEEIMAKYRKAGDASSAASQARNKLMERQEKLERLSKNTEKLQDGAEDFAALANELVKTMEGRKWWKI